VNTRPDETLWKDIADVLRELGVDYDRKTRNMIPKRRKALLGPPKKSKLGSGISMTVILADGSLTPPIADGNERYRRSALVHPMKGGKNETTLA
jgi:hypothetical protein